MKCTLRSTKTHKKQTSRIYLSNLSTKTVSPSLQRGNTTFVILNHQVLSTDRNMTIRLNHKPLTLCCFHYEDPGMSSTACCDRQSIGHHRPCSASPNLLAEDLPELYYKIDSHFSYVMTVKAVNSD